MAQLIVDASTGLINAMVAIDTHTIEVLADLDSTEITGSQPYLLRKWHALEGFHDSRDAGAASMAPPGWCLRGGAGGTATEKWLLWRCRADHEPLVARRHIELPRIWDPAHEPSQLNGEVEDRNDTSADDARSTVVP